MLGSSGTGATKDQQLWLGGHEVMTVQELIEENRQLRARVDELFDAVQRMRSMCFPNTRLVILPKALSDIHAIATKVIERPGSKE